MSRGYGLKDLSRAKGYLPISPRQGLVSFLAALRFAQRRLLVGLAGDNRHVRRFAETEQYALLNLAGFFAPGGGKAADSVPLPAVTDRFGVPTRCALQPLAALPRLASGEVDRAGLAALQGDARSATGARKAPQNELERQLALIWQQVLRSGSPVHVDDNFFQLGGDSILSIQ